jgi:hypothetical protein
MKHNNTKDDGSRKCNKATPKQLCGHQISSSSSSSSSNNNNKNANNTKIEVSYVTYVSIFLL